MRTLMISHFIPYPLHSGAEIRNYNLLKRLSRDHEVWVAGMAEEGQAGDIAHLNSFCAGVVTADVIHSHAMDRPGLALKYLLKGWPLELRHYQSAQLIRKINELVTAMPFDVIEIEDSFFSLYLEAIPIALRKRCILTFHDINFSKAKLVARLEPRLTRKMRMWLYGQMMYSWEPFYAQQFGRCITVSEMDRLRLLARNPALKIDVVPNGVDFKLLVLQPRETGSQTILFVGNMDYRPNIDAVQYFCHDIFPAVLNQAPDAELYITGNNPPPDVLALANAKVKVTGTVEDLIPYYARAAVTIVPLRAGGGTRLKILEAMALGRPVVSTSIGCEGLDVENGRHLFVADTPDLFANKVVQLLREPAEWDRIVANGRDLVQQFFDWDVIAQRLEQTYRTVAVSQ